MPPAILFVHAHPDDESIGTGATMARYAATGARVTLVTCTRGEEGDIVPAELAGLAADRDGLLAPHRVGELDAACAALGVADHRFLGGPGRWRDSGMLGSPANDHPRSFLRAGLDEASAALAGVIREVRPQVLVSYAADGGYGHPDHVQAHRVTRAAFERCDPAWRPARLYAVVTPESALAGGRTRSVAQGAGTPDAAVTTRIDAGGYLPAKLAALRAHRTQLTVEGTGFALSDGVPQPAGGIEHYVRLFGGPLPVDPDGYERELFAPAELAPAERS
ncbi:N-acetyl-1-D-myo-inositol-2-amino-2-deoxy-alpha-D-glucopyranoside deacetylase [Dactylosporangium salmoneum]|uniref:1D-myo-inositol 2-acetamido-2-deoxy-alpha-D-glucopyranoside deacetylase n=1 Tax=Dactylosporangium salmoneum TaxID=53361 RepID=A0ABN3H8J6_9ACTN